MNVRFRVLAVGALAAGVGVAWLLLAQQRRPALVVVAAVVVGWSFVASGLLAWWQRPENLIGPVMVATGFARLAAELMWVPQPVLFSLGHLVHPLHLAGVGYVLLAFPSGRLGTALNRWILGGAIVARWEKEGVTQAVHDALRARLRIAEGRQVEPTAGIVDSQSVKGADTVGRHSRGYDAGKKVDGRKRFIAVDTLGLLLAVLVTPASVHDTAGGRRLLLAVYVAGRRLRHLFTDSGFAGTLPRRSASRSPGSPARVVGTRLIRPWQARGEVEVLRCPRVQQAVLSHAIVAAALGGLDGRARQPVNRLLWW